jgi:hypothetical protein
VKKTPVSVSGSVFTTPVEAEALNVWSQMFLSHHGEIELVQQIPLPPVTSESLHTVPLRVLVEVVASPNVPVIRNKSSLGHIFSRAKASLYCCLRVLFYCHIVDLWTTKNLPPPPASHNRNIKLVCTYLPINQ